MNERTITVKIIFNGHHPYWDAIFQFELYNGGGMHYGNSSYVEIRRYNLQGKEIEDNRRTIDTRYDTSVKEFDKWVLTFLERNYKKHTATIISDKVGMPF